MYLNTAERPGPLKTQTLLGSKSPPEHDLTVEQIGSHKLPCRAFDSSTIQMHRYARTFNKGVAEPTETS